MQQQFQHKIWKQQIATKRKGAVLIVHKYYKRTGVPWDHSDVRYNWGTRNSVLPNANARSMVVALLIAAKVMKIKKGYVPMCHICIKWSEHTGLSLKHTNITGVPKNV